VNKTLQAFGYPENLIKEFEHWVVLIRPKQVTVGSLVLAAKSEALHLGEINSEEWGEFEEVSRYAEEITKKAFGAEKFNYLALMMKDPNVHFHFIPRYSKPVKLGDISYIDVDWPYKTELAEVKMPPEDFAAVKSRLIRGE
jgi:diadenosine tetraphosphate (Ap4A) HIT family hydrolase